MTFLFLIAYISLFILNIVLCLDKKRAFFAPQMWFSGLWCIVGILSNLEIYSLYKPSSFVNITIITGIVVFDIVSMALIEHDARDISAIAPDVLNSKLDVPLIAAINLACIVILVPTLLISISYVMKGDFTALRTAIFSNEFTSTFQNAVRSYLINPIVTATVLVGLTSLFFGKERSALVFLMGLTGCFAITLAEASRVMLIKTLTFLLIAVVVAPKRGISRIKYTRKEKLLTVLAIAILVSASLAISKDRSIDRNYLKSLYTYYFAGPSYLTQLLANGNPSFTLFRDYLLGGASFGGIINIPLMILMYLGFGVKDTTYIVGSVLTSGNLPISPSLTLNAMCTCFFDFFVDWGYMGMFMGPALLGGITALLINSYARAKTIARFSLLVFWFYILTRTVFALDTINPGFIITIMCIVLFCRNSSRSNV